MDITINLVMYIGVLILQTCRIDCFILWFLAFRTSCLCNLCIQFVLLFELNTVCMLTCIIDTVIRSLCFRISHICKLLVPRHCLLVIHRYDKITLVSILIDTIQTILIDTTEIHVRCLDTTLRCLLKECNRL